MRRFVAVPAVVLLFAACQNAVESPSPSPTSTSDPLAAVRRHVAELRDVPGFAEFLVSGAPDWSAVADDAVWIGNEPSQRLQRLDPGSNSFTNFARGFGPCNGLAVGFGSLWSADCEGSRMIRVSLATGAIEAEIPSQIGSGGEGLTAAGEGFVWFIGTPGTLVIVDPATNTTSTMEVPVGAVAATVGFGAVWLSDQGEQNVLRIDPVARTITATIEIGGTPRFLVAGEGAVWVLNQANGTVARIDPATNTVTATIVADSPGQGGCIAVGSGAVWTTTFDRPLTRIDAATNEVTAQYMGGQSGDCVAVGFDSVWLSNLRLGSVWRIPLPLP